MSADEYHDLCRLIRVYTLRRYGRPAEWVAFGLGPLGEVRDVVPPYPFLCPGGGPDAQPICRPEPPSDPAGEGPAAGRPRHSPDFRQVGWPGLGSFALSPKQALAVRELWSARLGGASPDVPERELLAAADSDGDRLQDLFKRSPAWGVLVLRGSRPGTFRLPEPPKGAEA